MTPFHRRRHGHRLAAAASICTVLFASSSSTRLELSPPTAFAFSHRHAAAVGGPPRAPSAIDALPPSQPLRATSRRGCLPETEPSPRQDCLRRAPFQPFKVKVGNLRPSSALRSRPGKYDVDLTALLSDSADDEGAPSSEENGPSATEPSSLRRDLGSIVTLVGAQALLLPISYFLARALDLPNHGLGAAFAWTWPAAVQGLKWTAPLFAVAGIMRLAEPYSESLQGVTKATQRSVLAVMGKERRPLFALLVSILLGAAAGWGEEWLFRGVLQTILSEKFSSDVALAICGVVFGLLHAVTPVYALLAGLASVFFGYLYNLTQNLSVPIICHAAYDVGALVWAHWSVTGLTSEEQDEILEAGPGAPIMSASAADK